MWQNSALWLDRTPQCGTTNYNNGSYQTPSLSCGSDVQVCHQRHNSALDLLLIFLCSLIQTLTLTPPPNNALLANMDMRVLRNGVWPRETRFRMPSLCSVVKLLYVPSDGCLLHALVSLLNVVTPTHPYLAVVNLQWHQNLQAKGHKYYPMTTPLILNVVIVTTKHLFHVCHCQQSILVQFNVH